MKIIYKIFRIVDIPELTGKEYIDREYGDMPLFRSVLEDLPQIENLNTEYATENGALMELGTSPYFKENAGDYIIQKIYRITEK